MLLLNLSLFLSLLSELVLVSLDALLLLLSLWPYVQTSHSSVYKENSAQNTETVFIQIKEKRPQARICQQKKVRNISKKPKTVDLLTCREDASLILQTHGAASSIFNAVAKWIIPDSRLLWVSHHNESNKGGFITIKWRVIHDVIRLCMQGSSRTV